MKPNSDILRLRVLLCFLSSENNCTVTGIARTLGEEKYKISRILSSLEKEKLVDKTNPRSIGLTELGAIEAEKYSQRIRIVLNHLTYEGLDTQSALHDAFYWALYSTKKSIEVISSTEKKYRLKYKLRDKESFGGKFFCRQLENGVYRFPFVVYSQSISDNSNISHTNGCFINPCTLTVENGKGFVQLQAVNNFKNSAKIQTIEYSDGDLLIRAEKSADVFSFPAEAVKFINLGSGIDQIMHGSLKLKIQYSQNGGDIVDETGILTLLI